MHMNNPFKKLNEMDVKEINIYRNLEKQINAKFKDINGLSIGTKERYKEAVKSFGRFLVQYRKQNISKIKMSHIQAYADKLKAEGYSSSYITTNLSAIRCFYNKVTNGKIKIPNNTGLYVAPRTMKERIGRNRAMPIEVYEGLISSASRYGKPDFIDILRLSRVFGMRTHEAFKIRRSHINKAIKTRKLSIKGKGGLVRELKLTEEELNMLKEIKGTNYTSNDRIFVKKTEKTHLKMKKFFTFVKDYRLDDKYTNHGNRHTYAQKTYKELLGAGLSIYKAQKELARRLGHGRVEVCRIYLENSDTWL